LRWSRQDYKFFFYLSCVARTLWGSWDQYNLASLFVTRTSTMTSVLRAQKPQMSRSPRSSLLEQDKRWTGDLGSLALVSSAVHLEWIISLTQTAEGASALDAKLHSSSLISLCCRITRPPTLHSRAWRTSNFGPQPSQCDGRSPGVLVWLSKSASLNSCAKISVLLSVEVMTLSHCPVSFLKDLVPLNAAKM
jgi:hypothetical protein